MLFGYNDCSNLEKAMKITIPTTCPCCDYPLETVNDQLFCRNQSCSAQLSKKLEHFAKTLGIKGLGPKTVEKLDLQDLTEIFYLDVVEITERLGSAKVAEKLIDEINRARGADLATVLASFSIPLVGSTASTKIAAVVNSIDEITADKCKEAGLGAKVTENLLSWLNTDYLEMKEFLPFSFTSNTEVANGSQKSVCITGKTVSFKTKADAYNALKQKGYAIHESVTKSTDYLVDEQDGASTKRKKADQYGITIIKNLNQFLKETQ